MSEWGRGGVPRGGEEEERRSDLLSIRHRLLVERGAGFMADSASAAGTHPPSPHQTAPQHQLQYLHMQEETDPHGKLARGRAGGGGGRSFRASGRSLGPGRRGGGREVYGTTVHSGIFHCIITCM